MKRVMTVLPNTAIGKEAERQNLKKKKKQGGILKQMLPLQNVNYLDHWFCYHNFWQAMLIIFTKYHGFCFRVRVPPESFLIFEFCTKPTCSLHTSSYVQVKIWWKFFIFSWNFSPFFAQYIIYIQLAYQFPNLGKNWIVIFLTFL